MLADPEDDEERRHREKVGGVVADERTGGRGFVVEIEGHRIETRRAS